MSLSNAWVSQTYSRLTMLQRTYAEVMGIIQTDTRAADEKKIQGNGDLVDLAFVLREMAKLGDDIRKECTKLQERLESQCGEQVTLTQLVDPSVQDTVHGQLAKGTVRLKLIPIVPKKDSPEYGELLNALGVSADSINNNVVHVHWPGLCDYVTKLGEEGKPSPAGIDPKKTYPQYRLTLRKILE